MNTYSYEKNPNYLHLYNHWEEPIIKPSTGLTIRLLRHTSAISDTNAVNEGKVKRSEHDEDAWTAPRRRKIV